VVDLIHMKAYTYTPDGDGKGKELRDPRGARRAATTAHERWSRSIAEGNDALLEEFFAEGTLPVEHIVKGSAPR
jgi:elongation factor G